MSGTRTTTPQTLAAIQQLQRLSELPPITTTSPVSTGIDGLDRILSGGLPRGHITSFIGAPTSGATTCALSTMAQTQRSGEIAACIDVNHTLDMVYAARCGVDLKQALIIHPAGAHEVPAMLRDLVFSQAISVIVLSGLHDLLDNPAEVKALISGMGLLNGSRTGSACAVIMLVSREFRKAQALLEGQDALRMYFKSQTWLTDGADILGYRTRVKVLKHRWSYERPMVEITISFDITVQGDAT